VPAAEAVGTLGGKLAAAFRPDAAAGASPGAEGRPFGPWFAVAFPGFCGGTGRLILRASC
jgi:hypothetical protein